MGIVRDSKGRIRYRCSFCGNEIERKGFDISAVVLVANWEDEAKKRRQQFFCHMDCFTKAAPFAEIHITRPDFQAP